MFHFPHLPPPGLCVQPGVTAHHRCRVAPFGNPGISLLDGSSWLIAVIPRPSSARSAKASTVRRSHLTCATPRACTAERELAPEVVAHPEAPDRRRAPRCVRSSIRSRSSAVISACRQNHTRTSRAHPAAASNQLTREYPAAPLMSMGTDAVADSRGGCCGRISITMSLVKAPPTLGRPRRNVGCGTRGARSHVTHVPEQMSTSALQIRWLVGG